MVIIIVLEDIMEFRMEENLFCQYLINLIIILFAQCIKIKYNLIHPEGNSSVNMS